MDKTRDEEGNLIVSERHKKNWRQDHTRYGKKTRDGTQHRAYKDNFRTFADDDYKETVKADLIW